MWMQPLVQPAAPPSSQLASMEVSKDTVHSLEMKSSSSSSKKKSNGKAKAFEALTHQQQVEEEEENLNQLLRCIEDAGVKSELAELACSSINDEVVHILIERLLGHIEML